MVSTVAWPVAPIRIASYVTIAIPTAIPIPIPCPGVGAARVSLRLQLELELERALGGWLIGSGLAVLCYLPRLGLRLGFRLWL